jgi:hypothetical protein
VDLRLGINTETCCGPMRGSGIPHQPSGSVTISVRLRHVGHLFSSAEQPLDKCQRLAQRLQAVVGFGYSVGQASFQQPNPAAAVQKGPESRTPGMGTELLVGELDLDGLIAALELNLGSHRLVSRACAR